MRYLVKILSVGLLAALVSCSGGSVPAVRDYTNGNPAHVINPQSVIARCPPYDPDCVGGGGGGGGTVPCDLETQTLATVPSNRARTTIGVGEQVKISSTNGGTLSVTSSDGYSVLSQGSSPAVLTASYLQGTATITVTGSDTCKQRSTTFTIVAPTTDYYTANGTITHDQGLADIEEWAAVYFGPSSVNFQNLWFEEGTGTYSVSGTWYCNGNHVPAQAVQVGGTYDATKGWQIGYDDNAEGACYPVTDHADQLLDSTATFNIPTLYAVSGYPYFNINAVTLLVTDRNGGNLAISKDQMQGSTTVDHTSSQGGP